MEAFINLTVIDRTGVKTERMFNLRYIKSFDPKSRTVMLEGNIKPFFITEESAERLKTLISTKKKKLF